MKRDKVEEARISREAREEARKKVRKAFGHIGSGGHEFDHLLDLENMHYYWCPINDPNNVLAVQTFEELGYRKFKTPKGVAIDDPNRMDSEGHLFKNLGKHKDSTRAILMEIPMDDWLLLESVKEEERNDKQVRDEKGDLVNLSKETESSRTTKGDYGSINEKVIKSETLNM